MLSKDEVIGVLREMADLLEITGANPFEVMAYRNGAQSLDDWSGDLTEAVSDSSLSEIPSIGKGLTQVISELVQTGSASERERVRGLVPNELPTLLRIRGLGPKRVRALWQELEIESPDDLRRAINEGQVVSLRGFGAKTVERILSGLDYLQNSPARKRKTETTRPSIPEAPGARGRMLVGTSGYSYAGWRGGFYPEDARADDFLELYAARLPSVEINNTFYRFPSEKVIGQWKSQTPEHFLFAVKVHRRITHQLRLGPSAGDKIVEFIERCSQLGARLGCILFQLPPNLARDDERLDTLLGALPSGPRYAVEFRHDSWFGENVLQKLRERNIACVAGDAEGEAPRRVATADFVYTRLRRASYSESELDEWDEWFRGQQAENRDVLAYLKHDDQGDIPQAVVTRWAPAKATAAREILREKLAKPPSKTRKRGRKTG